MPGGGEAQDRQVLVEGSYCTRQVGFRRDVGAEAYIGDVLGGFSLSAGVQSRHQPI